MHSDLRRRAAADAPETAPRSLGRVRTRRQVVDYALPGILSFLLVFAFLASFGYLVATMSPRDPDDDGARV